MVAGPFKKVSGNSRDSTYLIAKVGGVDRLLVGIAARRSAGHSKFIDHINRHLEQLIAKKPELNFDGLKTAAFELMDSVCQALLS